MDRAANRRWIAGATPIYWLLALLIVEKLSLLSLPPSWMLVWVHRLSGSPVLFFVALLFFGRRQLLSVTRSNITWSRPFVLLHVTTLLLLAAVQIGFYRAHLEPGTRSFDLVATVWTLLIPVAIVTLFATALPLHRMGRLVVSLGAAWGYAAVTTATLVLVRRMASGPLDEHQFALGPVLHDACFRQTSWLVHRLYPVVLAFPEQHVLGTPNFLVEIDWLCSGIEGLAIVAVLATLWLVVTRRELRMARAVWVGPLALGLTWCANLLRLVLLIVIGEHGYPQIADRGFHAQAGWITLNLVALGCLALVQRVPWFQKDGLGASGNRVPVAPPTVTETNDTVAYLLPFAAITAASLLSQAGSSGFEWLYPLRLVVALVVLWVMRRHYRAMDWRFGWTGPIAGLLVTGLWLGMHVALRPGGGTAIDTAAGLASLPVGARVAWIAIRVFAASVTVPIAEELAFRGFLARRVMRADFEQVSYRDMTVLSLVVSSAAFGALHGSMWAAGVAAGAIFWAVARWRGRLGEAVAAHAVANLALAVIAVVRNDYSLW